MSIFFDAESRTVNGLQSRTKYPNDDSTKIDEINLKRTFIFFTQSDIHNHKTTSKERK